MRENACHKIQCVQLCFYFYICIYHLLLAVHVFWSGEGLNNHAVTCVYACPKTNVKNMCVHIFVYILSSIGYCKRYLNMYSKTQNTQIFTQNQKPK